MKGRIRPGVSGTAEGGIVQQDSEAGRDRLQLQGYIGYHPNDGDDRNQAGKRCVLAVARPEESGNGGDAVGLADAQDFPEQQPAEAKDERRPEIDRQKGDAALCGPADAAVEGPGGTVDGYGKRIDNARI